jgi:hypothetical protein
MTARTKVYLQIAGRVWSIIAGAAEISIRLYLIVWMLDRPDKVLAILQWMWGK